MIKWFLSLFKKNESWKDKKCHCFFCGGRSHNEIYDKQLGREV